MSRYLEIMKYILSNNIVIYSLCRVEKRAYHIHLRVYIYIDTMSNLIRCISLSAGGHAPDRLQQVMVPILNTSVCNAGSWYDGAVDDTMICAGYEEGGRDSCQVR